MALAVSTGPDCTLRTGLKMKEAPRTTAKVGTIQSQREGANGRGAWVVQIIVGTKDKSSRARLIQESV